MVIRRLWRTPLVQRCWESKLCRFIRHTPWLHLVVVLGVSVSYAFALDREQSEEFARDFAHDTALTIYTNCVSGNRVREGNRDLVDGILAVLGPEGRETFLPIWREAQNDFQPRDCDPFRANAVVAGATDAELDKAEAIPPPVSSLPLATCDGVGPFVRGEDDAYIAELDRDGDGVACEHPGGTTTTSSPVSCADLPGPVREGEPGYDPSLDRDGDGVACER